ncbi:MAG: LD-carboxypeptidase [Sphingobacteriia bacterium]|nr:MAG: LD-carboxypeptidase [Sphingobacteriia bacterium]
MFKKIILPPALQKGDTIGLTCPAGFLPRDKAKACIKTLQSWGFDVMVGLSVGRDQGHYFAGSEEERRDELQAMMDNPQIKAILCGRGGYGTSPLLAGLDFTAIRRHPKWVVGFSDITALLAALYVQAGMAAIHGPMANAFNDKKAGGKLALHSLHQVLLGKKIHYKVPPHPMNKKGQATGRLVGGNLAMVTHLVGSPAAWPMQNAILFLEDIGEHLYKIDRMIIQLERAGLLAQIAGLVLGQFSDAEDTTRPFGKDLASLLAARFQGLDIPICFGFPVGHVSHNLALPTGQQCLLEVRKSGAILKSL